jgi:hypothetical protein
MTGSTQIISLDPRYKHWDPNGNPITQLSIPDITGTYVTFETSVLPAPKISPRFGVPATSPVLVTITSDIPSTTIRYTLNGIPPVTTSLIYTEPLQLSVSTVVQASTYLKGNNPSWASIASYTVDSSLPTVQFVSALHSGPVGVYFPVLLLSAAPAETVTVNYSVLGSSGTTTGSVSFLPNNIYRYFPITVSGASGTQTSVTITSVTGAVLGIIDAFAYEVQ